MNRESIALALTGGIIGVFALSAATFARLHPLPREESTAALEAMRETVQLAATTEQVAVLPVLAEQEPADAEAGPFSIAIRAPDPVPGEKLFVCDTLGCPLEGIHPDRNGSARLGPLPPGRYSVQRGQTEVAAFCLRDDASIGETSGRVWTDGTLLWLERFIPGTARVSVKLRSTGYYTLELRDRDGRAWRRDLYIPDGTQAEADGVWTRVLDFQGLPPGLYTAVRRNQPLGQVEVPAGEIAALEIEISK